MRFLSGLPRKVCIAGCSGIIRKGNPKARAARLAAAVRAVQIAEDEAARQTAAQTNGNGNGAPSTTHIAQKNEAISRAIRELTTDGEISTNPDVNNFSSDTSDTLASEYSSPRELIHQCIFQALTEANLSLDDLDGLIAVV